MVQSFLLKFAVVAFVGCLLVSASPCPNTTLGPDCGFPCQCLDTGQCDSDTRDCGSMGCLPGFMGPACLQENGAFNLTSSALYDGNSSTCITVTSTWSVTLTSASRITWIRLRSGYTGWAVRLREDGGTLGCGEGEQWLRDGKVQDWHCPRGPTTDTILLTPPGGLPTTLCEVEVYTPTLSNVAVGRPATQIVSGGQGDGSGVARLAVDGNNSHNFTGGSCIITPVLYTLQCLGGFLNPWWAVNLQLPWEIHRIVIFNRDGQFFSNFLQGFRLSLLGNEGWQEVYMDPTPVSENMPLLVDVPLSDVRTATALNISKEGCTSLQFCEVEVYASQSCTAGSYGVGCNQTCSCRDVNETCHPLTGGCSSGCTDGKTGVDCSKDCPDGSYGTACQQLCTCRNDTEVCDKVTGTCLLGCPDGRIGADCKQECREGWYGRDCLLECAANCSHCDPVNGTCYDVCSPGWIGFRCSQRCPGGTFGVGCRYNCSGNCVSECSPVDGTCPDGCQPGWTGSLCNTSCSNGTFGADCQSNCSQNCVEFCSRFNGDCYGGCRPGWNGSHCDSVCAAGFYGLGCAYNCTGFFCNGTCAPVDGNCDANCLPGWLGGWCNVSCPNGTYGAQCSSNCSLNCIGGCNHVTGYCNLGCREGFSGLLCDVFIPGAAGNNTVGDGGALASLSGIFIWILIGSAAAMVFIVVLSVVVVSMRDKREKRKVNEFLEREKERDMRSAQAYADAVHETRQADKEAEKRHKKTMDIRKVPADVIRKNHREVNVEGTPKRGDLAMEEARRESVALCYSGLDLDSSLTNILVHNLPAFMRRWQSNDDYFKEEFMNLPLGLNTAGNKDVVLNVQNRKLLNRASRALDWLSEKAGRQSRVIMQTVPTVPTDTIISGYVDSFTRTKAFIASKSPDETIVNNFVRMLWEFDVQKIVMLNNLVENDKMVCTPYWPVSGGELMFGRIKVSLMNYTAKDEYTIRNLELSQQGTGKKKMVTQYHFTRWYDDAVPDSPWPVLDFRAEVVARMENSTSPVVVHCSDGYGRTGTFLAINNLMDQALMDREIDVYACVYKLRQQRVNMVQTVRQYKFVYEILTAYVESSPSFEGDLGQPPTRAKPRVPQIKEETEGEEYMNLDEAEMTVKSTMDDVNNMSVEYCAMGVPLIKVDKSEDAATPEAGSAQEDVEAQDGGAQYATMHTSTAPEPKDQYEDYANLDEIEETST